MRFGRLHPLALAAAFGALMVGAPAAEASKDAGRDPCGELQGEADAARFACVADGEGGNWAVRLDAPVDGARDLTVSATHVDRFGAQTPFTARVPDAAAWFYTIAPMDRGAFVREGALHVELTRFGFRSYPVGSLVFRSWTP